MKFWKPDKSDKKKGRCGDNGYWNVESEPQGADPLPESDDFQGYKSCFATSYRHCEKEQLINLKTFGISNQIMDEYQPTITVSEWLVVNFCSYEKLHVLLKRYILIRYFMKLIHIFLFRYAGRFDCGCVYELSVFLLNEEKTIIHVKDGDIKKVLQWNGKKWEKVMIFLIEKTTYVVFECFNSK